MNKKVLPLKTERLVLREIEEGDAAWIVRLRSVPEVYQYFSSPKSITLEEHKEWYFNHYVKDKNRIDFIASEKGSRNVGVFSIKQCIEDKECGEIGYLLDKDAQGQGYAQEGVRRLMLFAKENWSCKKVLLMIHEENAASQILAHRLGYQKKSRKGNFFLYYFDLKNLWGGVLGQ